MDFTNLKVLVIGDCCLDIVEGGISTRLAPECAVPVILNSTKKYSVGMAGNVAMNLKSLGADVYLSTHIGKDKYGRKIKEILAENNIKSDFNYSNFSSIVKKRVFANGHQVTRLDREDILPDDLSYKYYKNYMETINSSLRRFFDLVIISDYNKGVINHMSWDYIYSLIEYVNKGNVFVDTKKINVADYFSEMILFPNTDELIKIIELYGMASSLNLREFLGSELLIRTASENGAFSYSSSGIHHSNALNENPVDVYGCGDTFISAFSLYYTKFGNIVKSLEFANYCSSKAASIKGLASVNINSVIDFLRGCDK